MNLSKQEVEQIKGALQYGKGLTASFGFGFECSKALAMIERNEKAYAEQIRLREVFRLMEEQQNAEFEEHKKICAAYQADKLKTMREGSK